MLRSARRCSPVLENLEVRQVMSAGGPSAEAQAMLEMVNEARTNPPAAAVRATSNIDGEVQSTLNFYHVDLGQARQQIAAAPAQPPLAWNGDLAEAADWQSHDQINHNYQGHQRPDGTGPGLADRLGNAGYDGMTSAAENAYAYAKSVDVAMKAFLIDWGVESRGHFNNIMKPELREVGFGIVDNSTGLGPKVVTQDFGARAGDKATLVGVVFQDQNNDHFYNVGEGRGDVSIRVLDADGNAVAALKTWDAGGYQVRLDPGNYTVEATQGDKQWTKPVSVGTLNVKVDFDLSTPGKTAVAASAFEQKPVALAQQLIAPTQAPTPSTSSPLFGTGAKSWTYSWTSWSSRSKKG